MKPNVFAKWLKGVIVGTTLIGIASCFYAIPAAADFFTEKYPEFSNWALPWEILLEICSVPCFAAMIISWKIASNIQNDRSFSRDNSQLFKKFSLLALGDSVVFMLGCVIYLFCGMNHPGLLIAQMLIMFVGLAVFICTAALSYLVGQAASLQEENDLTI